MPKNPRPGHRRLELWLPDGHPLWSLPPRTRSAYARALLDLGLMLEHRFSTVEKKLDHLLDVLSGKEQQLEKKMKDPSRNNSEKREFYNHNVGADETTRQGKNNYVEDFLTALERDTFSINRD
ncbi:MAG: hypothetical protein ACPLSY_05005 [Moorellaceae bacterium]